MARTNKCWARGAWRMPEPQVKHNNGIVRTAKSAAAHAERYARKRNDNIN
jgi:hypothetical protein